MLELFVSSLIRFLMSIYNEKGSLPDFLFSLLSICLLRERGIVKIYSELVRISLFRLSPRERGTATRWKEPANETLGFVLTYAFSFDPHRREPNEICCADEVRGVDINPLTRIFDIR